MENNKEVFSKIGTSEKQVRINQYLKNIKNRWYVFLLFAILGGFAGLAYYLWADPSYKATASLYYKPDALPGSMTSLFKDMELPTKNTSTLNQIELLTSFNIIYRSIKNLSWDVSYYRKSFLKETDLYKNEPFIITAQAGAYQTKDIPIIITPISDVAYSIETDEMSDSLGKRKRVHFADKGQFGKVFANEFFNFSVNKIKGQPLETGQQYKIIFNDLHKMALRYQDKLKVKLAGENTDIIYLELQTKSFSRGIDLLNEICNEYIQFGLNAKDLASDNTIEFIDRQILGVSDSLGRSSNKFSSFRSRNLTVDLDKEFSTIVEKTKDIDNQTSVLKGQLEYYKNLSNYVGNISSMKNLVAPSVVGIADPTLNALVQKLIDLYNQRETLSYTVQPSNPALINLEKQITYTQKNLTENIKNLVVDTEIGIENLSKQRQNVNSEISTLPKTEKNFQDIKRSVDFNNTLYTYLLQKRADAGIAKASHEPDAQIIDQADAVIPKLTIFIDIVAGFVLGLMIPAIIAFFLTYKSRKIRSLDAVDALVHLAVAGTVHHNKYDTPLPVRDYPNSIISESFRGLRTNLESLSKDKPCPVFAIHSGASGEGKSFISSNLAAILAMTGKKVLLVDGNLRNPGLYKIFNENTTQGLSEFLQGKASLEEIVKKTVIKNLQVVFAGLDPKNHIELLGPVLKTFIADAKAGCDYIIVDNAPSEIVNDSLQFSMYADINLFLLRLNYSTYDEARNISKRLHEEFLKNMILVVNDVPSTRKVRSKKLTKYFD